MDNKKVVIFGGGTLFHVRSHLALVVPAYGSTAKQLAEICKTHLPKLDVDLRLTKVAGGKDIETNDDLANAIEEIIKDDTTKVVIMNAAITDEGKVGATTSGKYAERLKSNQLHTIEVSPAEKLIAKIRETRKDIFLVGFKATCGFTEDEQYLAGLDLCKKSSCNLVLANDTKTRVNMIVTPEEARYAVTTNREEALTELVKMVAMRSNLTFTRSTVIAGNPIPWDSKLIPDSLRTVVNYCITQNAYRPFNGVTAGHFACKVDDNTFLTSIRKTDFNKLPEIGLVKIVTDGPDTVLAYGAKPSVGGQSQRIVFKDHPETDCIVHFHCPIKEGSKVPVVSQRDYECGSHQCGKNTSDGLKQFGNLQAVYLDEHGPNIVFNRNIDPQEVIDFIDNNFDLNHKTGGFVSVNRVNGEKFDAEEFRINVLKINKAVREALEEAEADTKEVAARDKKVVENVLR